ncbi:unnamed protein product [Calypogeia fissa]
MASETDRPLAKAFESLFRSSESIEYFIVDAFVGENCKGNPAAVVMLTEWKDEDWLQSVAAEFNLSETAYIVKKDKSSRNEEGNGQQVDSKEDSEHVIHEYDLRWFTPATEVSLCGHATLASAHVLYHSGIVGKKDSIFFHTKGGLLSSRLVGPKETDAQAPTEDANTPKVELLEMNFPWITTTPAAESYITALHDTLGTAKSVSLAKASNYLIVELETREDMDKLKPNVQELLKCDSDGLLAIAPGGEGSGFDFVSRCFFPKLGVNEDPVTGAAHCMLGPYWSSRCDKYDLLAHQVSQRGGILSLHMDKKVGRVLLRGQASISMAGVLVN